MEPPDEYKCPISRDVMTDPVVDCLGHTYDRCSIERALQNKPGWSPSTNQRFPGGEAKLVTNYLVKSMVDSWTARHGTQRPGGRPVRRKSPRALRGGSSTDYSNVIRVPRGGALSVTSQPTYGPAPPPRRGAGSGLEVARLDGGQRRGREVAIVVVMSMSRCVVMS